jgi:hypothetical protein
MGSRRCKQIDDLEATLRKRILLQREEDVSGESDVFVPNLPPR